MALIHEFPRPVVQSNPPTPIFFTVRLTLVNAGFPASRTLLLDGRMPLISAAANFIEAFNDTLTSDWRLRTKAFEWGESEGLDFDTSRSDTPICQVFSVDEESTLILDETWEIAITIEKISEKGGRSKPPACVSGVGMSPVDFFSSPEDLNVFLTALQDPKSRASKKILKEYADFKPDAFDRKELTKLLRDQEALDWFRTMLEIESDGPFPDDGNPDELKQEIENLEKLGKEIDEEIHARLNGGMAGGQKFEKDDLLIRTRNRLLPKYGEEETMMNIRTAFLNAGLQAWTTGEKFETVLAKTLRSLR